ncbi:MAG: hypothetical protein K0R69_2005 [Clostridia bacterium]|jgi:hypothetical protein|nr:hypothetical protein [Clostridia bacterium]
MIIYCSKAFQTALKLNKTDFATPVQLAIEDKPFYSWHGHIAKVDGRNTIVLMNDKTMYCLLFRNKLPRNKDKFSELVMEALPYTLEVGNVNTEEIVHYMSNIDSIVFAEKADRQITGNISRMILDMGYRWEYAWREDETIQAYEAYEQNRLLRKIGKDYIVPFEEMLKALCGIHE